MNLLLISGSNTKLKKEIENLIFNLERYEKNTDPSELMKKRKIQYQDRLIDLQLGYKERENKFYTPKETIPST